MGLKARVLRLDLTLRAVLVEGFFTKLGFGIVSLAVPLYALSLGMNIAEVGLVTAARALAIPIFKPIMGAVVDRYGVRRGYLTAVILRFAGSVLLLFATSPGTLIAVRLLQGAASSARDPASISALAAQTQLRLGRAFSASIGAKDLGNVMAGLIGGTVLAVTGGNFRLLWLVVVLLAAIPVVAVHRWVRDLPEPAERGDPSNESKERIADDDAPEPSPVRMRRLRLIGGLGLMTGLTAHMTHGLFPVYATEVAGLTTGQLGLVYSLAAIILVLAGPAFGLAADRFGTGPLMTVRSFANTASVAAYLAFPTFTGVLAGRLVDDAGKAAFRPTWGTMLAGVARREGSRSGRVVASLDTALSIGEALGPLLAGLLWEWQGVAAMFLTRAVLGVSVEVLVGRKLRRIDRPGSATTPEGAPHSRLEMAPEAGHTEGAAASQVVAANLARAIDMRSWGPEQVGTRLGSHLLRPGTVFTAEDLVALSALFDLPVAWFLLPPAIIGAGKKNDARFVNGQTVSPLSPERS